MPVLPRSIRILLIANVALFLIDFITRSAYLPRWLALDPNLVLHDFQIWRLFTYMFVHDSAPPFLHLLFNMLMLWMFGTPVAQEMGEKRFWWFYITAGLFAGVCSLLFFAITRNPTAVIGASGALFALLFAFARFFPTQRLLLFFIFPVEARYAVLIIGGIELLLITSNDNIAHIAHLGGALYAWAFLRWNLADLNVVDMWQARQHKARQIKAGRESKKLQDAMTDIDPILEKISRSGMGSLTREEKEKLDRVSEMKRNQRPNVIDIRDFRAKKK